MKFYTITHMEDVTSKKNDEDTNIYDLIRARHMKETNRTFDDFLQLEKKFLKLTENFIEYFKLENLYYEDNIFQIDYMECLKWELEWDKQLKEDIIKQLVHQAHMLAISGIEEVIKKAYLYDPDDFDEKVFVKDKEEVLSTMQLNFRNLLSTELTDVKTGASLDTGNSGLYYTLKVADNVDVKLFLENIKGLNIFDENNEKL